MNTGLVENASAAHLSHFPASPEGPHQAPWPLAMSRPDHFPRITQLLAMPPGMAARICHPAEDVIVR